jgi:hypothetical protein
VTRLLHIESIPPGEAPLWVRAKWVGLALPLAQRTASPRTFLTSGVRSGPKSLLSRLVALVTGGLERKSGYLDRGATSSSRKRWVV